jgi:hypothetical protein
VTGFDAEGEQFVLGGPGHAIAAVAGEDETVGDPRDSPSLNVAQYRLAHLLVASILSACRTTVGRLKSSRWNQGSAAVWAVNSASLCLLVLLIRRKSTRGC